LSSTSSTMNTNLLLILLATIVVSAYSYKCSDGTEVTCTLQSYGHCCPGSHCKTHHHDHGGNTYVCLKNCNAYHQSCEKDEDCCDAMICRGQGGNSRRCEDDD